MNNHRNSLNARNIRTPRCSRPSFQPVDLPTKLRVSNGSTNILPNLSMLFVFWQALEIQFSSFVSVDGLALHREWQSQLCSAGRVSMSKLLLAQLGVAIYTSCTHYSALRLHPIRIHLLGYMERKGLNAAGDNRQSEILLPQTEPRRERALVSWWFWTDVKRSTGSVRGTESIVGFKPHRHPPIRRKINREEQI